LHGGRAVAVADEGAKGPTENAGVGKDQRTVQTTCGSAVTALARSRNAVA
jgi:hypothetical protein